jgi:hypothetical protein
MWAINALVASLDHLCSFPNVLLLTMNNLTSSVNVAFLDRADFKVYVSLPILEAWYEILKETLMELLHVGIVQDHYVGIVWHHHDVFCNFHDVSTWSMSKTASVSPFWNAPKLPRSQVHEAFDSCLCRVMHCISNLQKGFPWRALLRH